MLVEPNSEKNDLPRLKLDVIKYGAAGIFGESAAQWWNEFTQSYEALYGSLPKDHPQWLMNLLVPANNVISQQVLINDRILQLHKADKESPPEVRKYLLAKLYVFKGFVYYTKLRHTIMYASFPVNFLSIQTVKFLIVF